jgi:integrase
MILEVPTKGLKLPRIRRREMRVFSLGEAKTFLKAALPTMYGTLFAVAVTTGMRPSEYIGLKWQDIDWARGTASVKRTLRKGLTGQWEYGETKRAGSRRIIRLQNWVLAKLKDLKQSQTENPVVDPDEWPEAVDLIFVTECGRPVNANSLSGKLQEVLFERFTRGLESLSELYDRDPQNVTNGNQIYEVEASLASFIFANKCLFDSHRFCHLILCQIPLFSQFA